MNNLAAEFKQALKLYFCNPNEKEYRNQLVRVSYSVLNDIQKKTGIAADEYMNGIDAFLKQCSLDSIKITENKFKLLDNFIRGLSLMDDMNIRQASNVLLLVHDYFSKQHFITNAEDKIRTQLFAFRYAVSKIGNINTAKTMNDMCDPLTALVDVHFSMPLSEQKTNYPALSLTVNQMISASKETIEKDFLLKKIVLNLVAAVAGLGVFYGLYLMVTATKRNTFFLQPAESVYLQNELDKAHDHWIAIRQEMQLDDPDQPTFASIVNL